MKSDKVLIEQVARAEYAVHIVRMRKVECPIPTWDGLDKHARAVWRTYARAALRAMRRKSA